MLALAPACILGVTQPTVDDPSLPAHVGPYRILARLGACGMGTVYRAAGVGMVHKGRLSFRIRWWRPWLLALALLAVPAAVGVVLTASAGNLASAGVILLVLAGAAVTLLLPIGLTVRLSRWHVGPHGVGGHNNWLVYHHLDWSEIESVEPWLIPGYRYLQVNGGGQRWAFWLPLFLTDMAGFRAAVARCAPPGNPLLRYLENHPD